MNIMVYLLHVSCLLFQLFSKWIENLYGLIKYEIHAWRVKFHRNNVNGEDIFKGKFGFM